VARRWHGLCVICEQNEARPAGPDNAPISNAGEIDTMLYIVMWLLGVPLGLIVLLWLLGVFS
jgi:hypothetical protein